MAEEQRDYTAPDAEGFFWYRLPSSNRQTEVFSWRREINGDLLFVRGVYENRVHLEKHDTGYTAVVTIDERLPNETTRIQAVKEFDRKAYPTVEKAMQATEVFWRQLDRIE